MGTLSQLDPLPLTRLLGKTAPLGQNHNRNIRQLDPIDNLMVHHRLHAILVLVNLPLMELEPDVLFVVQVPEPRDHGVVPLVGLVTIPVVELLVGGSVDSLLELKLPVGVRLVLGTELVLVLHIDPEFPPLPDNVHDVRGEPVVGVDLLLHQPVLVEVLVQDLPDVLLLEFLGGSLTHALNNNYKLVELLIPNIALSHSQLKFKLETTLISNL
jgi:hypothetical protein